MAENKERINGIETNTTKTERPIVDLSQEQVTVPREVKTWMEKLEETSQVPQVTITDDKTGQPIMTPAAPSNPVVTLPVSKRVFSGGFKKTVNDTGRWLSTFIFRMIKIKKGKVKFKEV